MLCFTYALSYTLSYVTLTSAFLTLPPLTLHHSFTLHFTLPCILIYLAIHYLYFTYPSLPLRTLPCLFLPYLPFPTLPSLFSLSISFPYHSLLIFPYLFLLCLTFPCLELYDTLTYHTLSGLAYLGTKLVCWSRVL